MGRMMHEARHGLPLEATGTMSWVIGMRCHTISLRCRPCHYLAVVIAMQERARDGSIAVMP